MGSTMVQLITECTQELGIPTPTTVAGNNIGITSSILEDLGNLLKHLVSNLMPEVVVELFELVNVQEQYRQWATLSLREA